MMGGMGGGAPPAGTCICIYGWVLVYVYMDGRMDVYVYIYICLYKYYILTYIAEIEIIYVYIYIQVRGLVVVEGGETGPLLKDMLRKKTHNPYTRKPAYSYKHGE
jgi:hypothetical protein